MSDRLSRRDALRRILFGAASLTLAACKIQNSTSQPPAELTSTPPVLSGEDETQRNLERLKQEVKRLAETYPTGSLTRSVYLASDLSTLNPAFKFQTSVGLADPNVTYARTYFTDFEYSDKSRFQYFLTKDGSLKDYQTLDGIHLKIFFSPVWLDSKSDEVKKIALEKEAYTVGQWTGFSGIPLGLYKSQGEIRPIDPSVTDNELANTLTVNLLTSNLNIMKLYDYAPYIMFLGRVGKILDSGDTRTIQELSVTNFPKVYQLAKAAAVPFENLQFGSQDYYKLAFGGDSPWVKIILDPGLPSADNVK